MARKNIPLNVMRSLYAESLGYCMNPDCKEKVVDFDGDISEKAHITEYYKTQDNSYENLIILCPNCHTKFDKNKDFTVKEVKSWKKQRQSELNNILEKTYSNFEELEKKVKPLLSENLSMYNNYYLQNNKQQWQKCENKIIINNTLIKNLLKKNENLLQDYKWDINSNKEIVKNFILHVDEFQRTRSDEEKMRTILYPKELNSIFGVKEDFQEDFIPSVESLESLINIFLKNDEFSHIELGEDKPYIQLNKLKNNKKIYLDDLPRIKQLYYTYNCFVSPKVRLKSLHFALKYLKNNNVEFKFRKLPNLREITVNSTNIIFVYEYCLTTEYLMREAYSEGSIIINLHNWNGEKSISKDAKDLAIKMNIKLLTMEEYYPYVRSIK